MNKLRADGLFKTSRLHFHSVGCSLHHQLVNQDSLLAMGGHEHIGKETKHTGRFVVILDLSTRMRKASFSFECVIFHVD